MSSAPPPRRPRPGPARHPVTPAPDTLPAAPERPSRRGVVLVGNETIRLPRIAACLRRHPRIRQRGGIAAIAGGLALFVVAGATTPIAGANTAGPKAAASTAAPPVPL